MADVMSADELRAAIEKLWGGNQHRAAEHLNVGYRTIRAYLAAPDKPSRRSIPDNVAEDVRWMLDQFPGGIREVNPRTTVAILQAQMVTTGFSPEGAASGILGAALANALAFVPADDLREWIDDALS